MTGNDRKLQDITGNDRKQKGNNRKLLGRSGHVRTGNDRTGHDGSQEIWTSQPLSLLQQLEYHQKG